MPYLKFTYPVRGRKAGDVAFVSPEKAAGYLRDGVAAKTTAPEPGDLPKVEASAPKLPVKSVPPKPGPAPKPAVKPKPGE